MSVVSQTGSFGLPAHLRRLSETANRANVLAIVNVFWRRLTFRIPPRVAARATKHRRVTTTHR